MRDRLKDDEEIVKLAVLQEPQALQYAGETPCANPVIVRLAVEKDGTTLEYASNALKADETNVKIAVQEDGLALKYASKELRANEDIVKLAVKQNGLAIQFASDKIKANEVFVREAIESPRHVIYSCTNHNEAIWKHRMLAGEDHCLTPSEQRPTILDLVDEKFRSRKEIVLLALRMNGLELEHVDDNLKNDEEIITAAEIQNANEAIRRTLHPNRYASIFNTSNIGGDESPSKYLRRE